jgi:hypothetical protein
MIGEKLGGFDTRYGGASAVDFHHASLFTEAHAPAPSAGTEYRIHSVCQP